MGGLTTTVARHDRVRERDEARRTEQTISPYVDQLFRKGLDWSDVADQVRNDTSLSEALRRAAINLVMKRCSAMREAARKDEAAKSPSE